MIKITVIVLLFKAVFCANHTALNSNKNFIYSNTYKYGTKINIYVNNETEQIMDFYEDSTVCTSCPTRVHLTTNDSALDEYPVFIMAMQQKGVSSWELPLPIRTDKYAVLSYKMSRTLCPHDAGPDIRSENRPTITISTENPKNASVEITLSRVVKDEFYVQVNKEISLNVTPSTPKYSFFSFDQEWNMTEHELRLPTFNYTIPKSVILVIDSDDELCATVSIQNNSCPVFDSEKEILYQGYHLTMTTKGGITLTQSMFPHGFYVVFIVRENDAECTGASETAPVSQADKMKTFRFSIIATVSLREYIIGGLVLLSAVVLVAAFVIAAGVPFRYRHYDEVLVEEPAPSSSQDATNQDEDTHDEAPIINETEECWYSPYALNVGSLSRAPADTLARRSDRYFWGALTLAVVYALPVVQLLFTYQQMVFATGNQDLCYYNFLCAHPVWMLSDFNHVYSNIGYIVLGGIFMLQVRARQRNRPDSQDMGIPQHYGLLYSMGLALCMEGFLSACYHLCPNKMNFQFDSSFMYVIAVLVMIKLYQNRHSDLIPSAHSTFMLLALIMSIGLFGILFPSVAFSVLFTILHLSTCLVLTFKIYYAGTFKMEFSVLGRAYSEFRMHGVHALFPAHRARAVLLALANVANWTFAIFSAYERNQDFARQLLAILMGNAILYTMFYLCMKLIHREKILIHTWLYVVCAHVAWFAALQQFLNGNTRWSETPALSRRHNAVCTMMGVLDSHDAWHALSAGALFLSFNMLATIDDALANTKRSDIKHTF